MKTVAIESPYAGDVEFNMRYLDICIRDCLYRSETPYASHRMLTSALDDNLPAERAFGIEAGRLMAAQLSERVFYVDNGWSNGMVSTRLWYEARGLSYIVRKVAPSVR